MLEILPAVLVRKKLKLDTIERIMGPFPAPKFKFVYEDDYFPVRGGISFYRIIDKKKNELFVDRKGTFLVTDKPKEFTFYGKYKNAKGSLSREAYLKPYKIVLTKKMKSKDTIIRYFAQYKLDKYDTIFEINKQNFNRESNFYKKIRLVWQLKGPKENILMKNEEALEVAENSMYGIQNFLDPLEFYEEDVTLEEKLQKKLSKLKFTPESTDTSSDPPPGWSAGDGPPPGYGY
jgi:hypothetical protein